MTDYLEEMLKLGHTYDQITPIDIYSFKELLAKLALEPEPVKVKSGVILLDNAVGGFEAERLYVLSAMTKHGKTTLAMTFMHNMARNGDASLFFSYEMGWKEIVRIFKLMNEKMNCNADIPLFLPLELHRGGGELQYKWLFEAIAKAKIERNIKFVVIDHLHFLLPLKDYNNTSFLIGGIVRELKRMAVVLKIPIMLIAHTQKLKDDKIPDWTDIRDSSFITQEADMVMMIYRKKAEDAPKKITSISTDEVFSNQAVLSIELNRMGGETKRIVLEHNGIMFVESQLDAKALDFAATVKSKMKLNQNNPNIPM